MNVYQPAGDDDSAPSGAYFEPFDLTVSLGPDAIPWLSAASRVGFIHGIPRATASLPPLAELLDRVYDYTGAIQYAEQQPEPELAQILKELVFGDARILSLFQATRGVAADRRRQLLFRILASPHLAVLPWELLPDPTAMQNGSGQRYLALAPDAHLVRLARGRLYPARTALLQTPLNLLIVLSSPTPSNESEDELAFDIFEVKRGLLAELSGLEQSGVLNIDIEVRPTLDNLRRRIGSRQGGYHLFHYVGHALPDLLILEDREGQRKDLNSSQFVEILRLCPDLRLAVFAGCETARAGGDPAALDPREAEGGRTLLSLADYCVQEACPTVIGMQAVLPFGTERLFTRFFYQALTNGYSTAEALRLARGAIQGDERLGGNLLDWSVPALFVGNSEPGPLAPRTAPAPRASRRLRWELKLGFRQGSDRFLARELPLRQAVDIMTGVATERVLLVTGAAGVGKSSLLDRALEEIGAEVTHVLYVPFDRLAPVIAQACTSLVAGNLPDLAEVTKLAHDHVVEQLCRLVTELLQYSKMKARARGSLNVAEWWDRLIEDLVQCKSVVVIDDVGLLDHAQHGLIEKLIGYWIAGYVKARLEVESKEQVLEQLEQQLSQLEESQEQGENMPQAMQGQLASIHADLPQFLGDLPRRLLEESSRVLGDLLEEKVVSLGSELSGEIKEDSTLRMIAVQGAIDAKVVFAALNALEAVRKSFGEALQVLADRRSPVRIVITARDKPQRFLDLPQGQVFEMRLAQLTWPEMWRWIRRNLPTLLSYGEEYLARLWSTYLGNQIERWEELEQNVLRERRKTMDVDLVGLATKLAPSAPARPVRSGALTARRGERALRIAVAGPHLAGPEALAEALTCFAIEHGIGGQARVDANDAGTLATLIDEPSPFTNEKTADLPDIIKWLHRVLARQPDVILLDYGADLSAGGIKSWQSLLDQHILNNAGRSQEYRLLRSVRYRTLLIAAGGNSYHGHISTPAAYPEVLGVGPLDDNGQICPYASWTPQLGKPDLFMADNLATSPLAAAIKPNLLSFHKQEGTWGSSFAALHAVATATLVWSILPEYSPWGIAALLVGASEPIVGRAPAVSLTAIKAVALARQRVVEQTLKAGPASLQTLVAITGLNQQTALATITRLVAMNKVGRLSSGRLVRYQWLGPTDNRAA